MTKNCQQDFYQEDSVKSNMFILKTDVL